MKIEIELGEVTNPNPNRPQDFTVSLRARFTNVQKPGSYEEVLNLVDEVKRSLPDGINPLEAFKIAIRVMDVVN